jgi:hypothetical protein
VRPHLGVGRGVPTENPSLVVVVAAQLHGVQVLAAHDFLSGLAFAEYMEKAGLVLAVGRGPIRVRGDAERSGCGGVLHTLQVPAGRLGARLPEACTGNTTLTEERLYLIGGRAKVEQNQHMRAFQRGQLDAREDCDVWVLGEAVYVRGVVVSYSDCMHSSGAGGIKQVRRSGLGVGEVVRRRGVYMQVAAPPA